MFRRRYARFLWAVAIGCVLIFAGYQAYESWSDSKPVRIEVVIKSSDDSIEFWQVMKAGFDVAAGEFGAQVEVTGSRTDADVDGQIARVEEAMARRPDAILLAANDYSRLVPVAEEVKRKGIRLFIVDSGIDSNVPESVIATDNFRAGQEAGTELLRHMDGVAGEVAIINYVGTAASLSDRERGVRSVLEKSPGIALLDTYNAEGLEENAYAIAKGLIRDHPNLQGIVGLNEPTSVGAGRAIRELRMQKRMVLIGFDSSINEIKLLEEGVMQATVIQKPFQMGYLSIKTIVDAMSGRSIPESIDTGSLVITKSNMYEEENQKLLFPFYDHD